MTSLKGGGRKKKDTPERESTRNHIIKLYDFHPNLGGAREIFDVAKGGRELFSMRKTFLLTHPPSVFNEPSLRKQRQAIPYNCSVYILQI